MTDSVEIALFPIPQSVTFPGTVQSLHVFEPRYRTMIHDAVRDGRMIGVCHTRKEIKAAPDGQTVEELLASNQATYQPHSVFSAGRCEIVEILADGRIGVNIHCEARYRILSEVQTLPYRIVVAEPLADEGEGAQCYDALQEVNELLADLLGNRDPRALAVLRHEQWLAQTPAEFSFKIFQFLSFDADIMQDILETTSPCDRLAQISHVLKSARAR